MTLHVYRSTEIETICGVSMKDPCNKALIPCWKTETKDATVDKWGEIHSGLKECCYSKKIDKKCQGSKLCQALYNDQMDGNITFTLSIYPMVFFYFILNCGLLKHSEMILDDNRSCINF